MDEQPQVTERAAQPYVGVPFTVTMETFPQAADTGFPELFGWLGQNGVAPSGPAVHPLSRHRHGRRAGGRDRRAG